MALERTCAFRIELWPVWSHDAASPNNTFRLQYTERLLCCGMLVISSVARIQDMASERDCTCSSVPTWQASAIVRVCVYVILVDRCLAICAFRTGAPCIYMHADEGRADGRFYLSCVNASACEWCCGSGTYIRHLFEIHNRRSSNNLTATTPNRRSGNKGSGLHATTPWKPALNAVDCN
jgi:hypothetical protein